MTEKFYNYTVYSNSIFSKPVQTGICTKLDEHFVEDTPMLSTVYFFDINKNQYYCFYSYRVKFWEISPR